MPENSGFVRQIIDSCKLTKEDVGSKFEIILKELKILKEETKDTKEILGKIRDLRPHTGKLEKKCEDLTEEVGK